MKCGGVCKISCALEKCLEPALGSRYDRRVVTEQQTSEDCHQNDSEEIGRTAFLPVSAFHKDSIGLYRGKYKKNPLDRTGQTDFSYDALPYWSMLLRKVSISSLEMPISMR